MLFYLCIIGLEAVPKMDRVVLINKPRQNCLQKIKAAGWQSAHEFIEE